MALIDFDLLRTPLSEQAPCGPDLDREGDAAYMNTMAEVEGLLPASYYAFERNPAALNSAYEDLSRLLERSHDIRTLALLAKLLVFDRDLTAFCSCMAAIAWLLDQRWTAVHPNGDDIELRGAVLQTLDDLPHVIFPLQYVPLFTSRRLGGISFRTYLIARGEAKPRDDEKTIDPGAIEQAVIDCDLTELIATRDGIASLKSSVALVRSAWIANDGFNDAPSLDRLTPLVDKMLAFLDGAVAKREPSAALNASGQDIQPDAGILDPQRSVVEGRGDVKPLLTNVDVAASLAAVTAYFSRREPSNPALLMIRQAHNLVGKNFIEVLRILAPRKFEESRVYIGVEKRVFFPMEQLAELMASSASDDQDLPIGLGETERVPDIQTRAQAIAELEQVTAFYRSHEPSSPIPLLIDRARSLASLDFMSLLREISPQDDG